MLQNHSTFHFSHVLIGLEKGEGTLKQFISNETIGKLRFFATTIMSQIVNGINYIHSFKIIHSDIKPNNIIYNIYCDKISIQIMDFG